MQTKIRAYVLSHESEGMTSSRQFVIPDEGILVLLFLLLLDLLLKCIAQFHFISFHF